jgi:hypothetical protein
LNREHQSARLSAIEQTLMPRIMPANVPCGGNAGERLLHFQPNRHAATRGAVVFWLTEVIRD